MYLNFDAEAANLCRNPMTLIEDIYTHTYTYIFIYAFFKYSKCLFLTEIS